jgi:hypothetical protein
MDERETSPNPARRALALGVLAFCACAVDDRAPDVADANLSLDPSAGGADTQGGNAEAGANGAATAGTDGIDTDGASREGSPSPVGVDGTQGSEGGGGEGGAGTGANDDGAGSGGESMPDGALAGAGGDNAMEPTPISRPEGPCDIYEAAGTPCVAAYSMVRALSAVYDGPLYQVRRGAPNALQNTGVGGQTLNIGWLPNGVADAAAQDAFCGNQPCTVSTLYDQSGRGNHLTVAKGGSLNGGQFAAEDDFESNATAGPLTVGGQGVYSLYMETRQGYRQAIAGNAVPLGQEAQGIYMLADGTRVGTACCWDFGNVTSDPTQYHTMNTLFLGVAYWGRGNGAGPWFMADFEAGVWAGGSNPGDAGWGALGDPAPPNSLNPSMRVRFALGFLSTDDDYALRMADVETATALTTAYEGPLPKPMDNQGAVVLGVGGDNSNNSFGTFFEGAIVSGYPSSDVDLAILQNVQSVGYGR